MTIKNQIDHRADYAKQKAAGQTMDATAGRHGRSRPRQQQRPRWPLAAEGKSLAEQMGIPIPADVQQRVDAAKTAQAAKPLEALTPPPTANVPETAKPETIVDPPQGAGELPPVAGLKVIAVEPPRPWVDEDRAVETNRPVVEVDAEEEDKEEPGAAPLV